MFKFLCSSFISVTWRIHMIKHTQKQSFRQDRIFSILKSFQKCRCTIRNSPKLIFQCRGISSSLSCNPTGSSENICLNCTLQPVLLLNIYPPHRWPAQYNTSQHCVLPSALFLCTTLSAVQQ